MKMPETPQALEEYLNQRFTCDCGREHFAPLRAVKIGQGALEELPDLIKIMGFESVFLITDEITNDIAGDECVRILNEAGIKNEVVQLTHTEFDEATLGELMINMPVDCDLVIAVGTGAINDMTRFFSFKAGRPFFTVATAAPMDGFASSVAAIQENDLKTTFEAQPPMAIIGDTDILKGAPYRMIAAGLGDLLGKFTCLCDWKLSRIINGEHYCPEIVELVESCVKNVLDNAHKAKDRDPEVLGKIMEGLVLTGVAMSLYGNSRPASGCEHHMSHYWEMIFEQRDQEPVSHGTQVGVGTVLVLKLVEKLRKTPVDFAAARAAAKAYDPEVWKAEIEKAYGPAAPGVIEMEDEAQKNAVEGHLKRLDVIEAHWDEIDGLLAALPSSQSIMDLLKSLDSPCLPREIHVDPELLRSTLYYCKEVRNRYTILQLLWDLDLLRPLADQLVEELSAQG